MSKDELRKEVSNLIQKMLNEAVPFPRKPLYFGDCVDAILNLLEGEITKAEYNCNVEADQPNDVHIQYFNQGYKKGLSDIEGEKQKARIDEQYAYDRQLVKCPFRYNDRDELAEFRLVLVDERFAPKPDDKLKQIEVDLTNTLEQFLQQPGGHSSPSSPRIAAEYFITRINDYIATLNKEPNKGEDV